MALAAFVLTTIISALPNAEGPLACTFPGSGGEIRPLTLNVEHTPSLFDLGSRFQVNLTVSDLGSFDAAAAPEEGSAHWDVIIRGFKKDRRVAVGLRADGTAILKLAVDTGEPQTRFGRCEGHELYLRRWTS